jgi:periplasmic protein TonB
MNHIPFHRKPVAIATAVVLLHVGGLAALQSGLLVRAYEIVIPVEMISQIVAPPKPETAPPPPPVPPPPSPAPPKQITLPPAPQPLAISDPTPAPNAPQVTPTPPAPLPPINAPVAAAPAPPAPPTQPAAPPTPPLPEKVTEPELSAEHQANEELFRPPPASKRLREFGTVLLSVTIGADGRAKNAVVAKSSGYARLDEAAVRGAMLARFKPATRGGIPIERKFSWPIIYPEPSS